MTQTDGRATPVLLALDRATTKAQLGEQLRILRALATPEPTFEKIRRNAFPNDGPSKRPKLSTVHRWFSGESAPASWQPLHAIVEYLARAAGLAAEKRPDLTSAFNAAWTRVDTNRANERKSRVPRWPRPEPGQRQATTDPTNVTSDSAPQPRIWPSSDGAVPAEPSPTVVTAYAERLDLPARSTAQMPVLSRRLVALRHARTLTHDDVARDALLGQRAIAEIESGTRPPTDLELRALAELYLVDANELRNPVPAEHVEDEIQEPQHLPRARGASSRSRQRRLSVWMARAAIVIAIAAAFPLILVFGPRSDSPSDDSVASQHPEGEAETPEVTPPSPSTSSVSPSSTPASATTASARTPAAAAQFPELSIQHTDTGMTMQPDGTLNGLQRLSVWFNRNNTAWRVRLRDRDLAGGVDYYELRYTGSTCVDTDPTDHQGAGAFIVLSLCSDATTQQWELTREEKFGGWQLKNRVSGHCLEFPGYKAEQAQYLLQQPCAAAGGQAWLLSSKGCGAESNDGDYTGLMARYDTTCTGRATQLQAWHWNGDRNTGRFEFFIRDGATIGFSQHKTWANGERATVSAPQADLAGKLACTRFLQKVADGTSWLQAGTDACALIERRP